MTSDRSSKAGDKSSKKGRALDGAGLERLALFYVGRYATTRARVRRYLLRKVRERGWADDEPANVESLVERLTALGYVDDAAFASARVQSLQRKGYGQRRISQALAFAGISTTEAAAAQDSSPEKALEAALRFARRRRIGPFAAETPDRRAREKAFGAMMRAGHPAEIVRIVLDLPSGEDPA